MDISPSYLLETPMNLIKVLPIVEVRLIANIFLEKLNVSNREEVEVGVSPIDGSITSFYI